MTDNELAADMDAYVDDPLGFVLDCFPWGVDELATESGPDVWQVQFLTDLGIKLRSRTFNGTDPVDPIRMAIASGHGIGKSALMAWLHWWIMSTRPDSKGRVTANTYKQLEMTTWAEIQRWGKLVSTREWWEIGPSKCYHRENPQWFSVPVTCDENNSEAFAGQHNKQSTSFFLMDESSLIPDKIHEVADAGLTDGEPMWFAAGNPTRNTGWFHDVCFGEMAYMWDPRSIDSRTCKFPNHRLHAEWIQHYGIDSDYVRVRILGMPPKTAEDQLIGKELVDGARNRKVEPFLQDPLIAGVDVPDGGSAWFVVRFRRGLSARAGPLVPLPIRMAGATVTRDSMVAILAKLLLETNPMQRIAMMFIDSQPGAAIVERLRSLGHERVREVSFAGPSPEPGDKPRFANMRAYMWGGAAKDWLEKGCIEFEDAKLKKDLTAPGFKYRVGGDGSMVIESKADMKDRGQASPDDGDAFVLTFAAPVAPIDMSDGYQDDRPRGRAWNA